MESQAKLVPCRDCENLVSRTARKCPNCGLVRPWEKPEDTWRLTPCRDCGKAVRGAPTKCRYCGAKYPTIPEWCVVIQSNKVLVPAAVLFSLLMTMFGYCG